MRTRLARPGRPLLVALVLGAVVAFPLGVVASHQFGDVPDSSTFHPDIDAIADAGITFGCGGGNYCPNDFVTRGQMAAFMNRLGALGPGKTPVANAATAVTADSADTAGNANNLDGIDGSNVLTDGPIVIHQLGPWQEYQLTLMDLRPGLAWTDIHLTSSNSATIVLDLRGPGTINGQEYGLQSVEICYGNAFDVSITQTAAHYGSVNGATPIFEDFSDRAMTTDACYTETDVTPQTPTASVALFLDLQWVDTTVARIGNVTSTWVPTN